MSEEKINRYKATIAYDGTNFSGFQVQPNGRTVQGEIEKALMQINKGNFIRIHPSGRTDAGVHASGMVFHFDYPNTITVDGLMKGLNGLTPEDISFYSLEKAAPDFHARYQSSGKVYTYTIDNNKIPNPFHRLYTYHHPYVLDKNCVETALKVIEGMHDFTSFSSTKSDKENKVRTIKRATIEIDEETNIWTFRFEGDGFLYNMIRILVGTILEIADGRREVEEMQIILEAKDRNAAGATIASHGLCLKEVHYNE